MKELIEMSSLAHHHKHCPQCPTETVFDPPVRVFEDVFHPQIVQVVHHVELVRRHHCVPVPCHVYTYSARDEFCPPMGVLRK